MPKQKATTMKELDVYERSRLANKIARAIFTAQGFEMDNDVDILDNELTNVDNSHPRITQLIQATSGVMQVLDEFFE